MEIIKMQNKLFESYIKSASRYLTEDEDELETVEDVEDTTGDEDFVADEEETLDNEGAEGEEDVLEIDLANPVCPSCGASLVIADEPIDTEDEELGLEDDEADAIQLLQGLGYIVYKPTEPADGEGVDDDFPGEDDEDFGEEEAIDDELAGEEDEEF